MSPLLDRANRLEFCSIDGKLISIQDWNLHLGLLAFTRESYTLIVHL